MSDVSLEALKVAPPVLVSGVHFAGFSLADWVSIATLIYLAFLIIVTAPKAYNTIKEWVKCLSKRDSPPPV